MVELFAQFHTVKQVADTIKAEYHTDLDLRSVATYDPSQRHCRMGKRLREHYDACRQAYVEASAKVGVAHQAHRLRLIERVIEKATTAKDFSSALKGLELAAKEMGGVLEGKSIVEHRGSVEHRHLSVEDARAELAMRLGAVIDGGTLQHALPTPDAAPDEASQPIENAG